jgi:hypothetical protein
MTRSITLDDRRPPPDSAPIQPLGPLHRADGVVAKDRTGEALDQRDERVEADGLVEVVGRREFGRLARVVALARDQCDRDARQNRTASQLAHDLPAVHHRLCEIEQDRHCRVNVRSFRPLYRAIRETNCHT